MRFLARFIGNGKFKTNRIRSAYHLFSDDPVLYPFLSEKHDVAINEGASINLVTQFPTSQPTISGGGQKSILWLQGSLLNTFINNKGIGPYLKPDSSYLQDRLENAQWNHKKDAHKSWIQRYGQRLNYSTSRKVSNDSPDSNKSEDKKTWIQMYLPNQIQPFAYLARLDRPIGTWLLAWPCFWSIALAADPGTLPDIYTLALFGTGSVLLRGAGCTINDLWDRKIDAQVSRTKNRPLASGVLSPFQGITFLGAQLLLGLGILVQLNQFSQILGASSLFLVGTYPLMKRITNWPQAYLGLTFNWGALLGWAAINGSLALPLVLPLYFGGVFWTLVYDTIYAVQDKEDDAKVGVKSTALFFGGKTVQWLNFFAICSTLSFSVVGINGEMGFPYFLGVGGAYAHLLWQINTLDYTNRQDCSNKFGSNKWVGALVFSGILLEKITHF